MAKKAVIFLVGLIGFGIGLGTGFYFWHPTNKPARFIDITQVNSHWKNGDIAYMRRHGDTTCLERYYGGSHQRYPSNIRIVTTFNTSREVILEGRASDLSPSTRQEIQQEVIRQADQSH